MATEPVRASSPRRPTSRWAWTFHLTAVVAVAGWIAWGLRVVDVHELAVRPLSGLAFATFVQLADSFAETGRWVQTAHQGYAEDWRWGGHYAGWWPLTAWISGFWSSPWALAREQVVLVGLGGLGAWALGWREMRGWGAIAGLAPYLGSGAALTLALSDYQDMTMAIPTGVLVVLGARHARHPAWFVVSCVPFALVREELLVVLPALALTGGWKRAAQGAGVSVFVALLWFSFGEPPYPNPMLDVGTFAAKTALGVPPPADGPQPAGAAFDPMLYLLFMDVGFPWSLVAPETLLAALPVIVVHAVDPTGTRGLGSPAVHHLAPLCAVALVGGMLGAARLMRRWPTRAPWIAALVVVVSLVRLATWEPALRKYAIRADAGPSVHPVWSLLPQVPSGDTVYLPDRLAPAAARTHRVVTRDSLGAKVRRTEVQWAISDEATYDGTVVAQEGGWMLVKGPNLRAEAWERRADKLPRDERPREALPVLQSRQ